MNIIFLPEKYRTQSYTNDVSFKRMIKPKKQSLYDLFVRTPVGYKNPKKSLDKILFIKPQFMAGTKCKGSIPLKNFWDFFWKRSIQGHIGECREARIPTFSGEAPQPDKYRDPGQGVRWRVMPYPSNQASVYPSPLLRTRP